jgi:hypothetical protein
MRARDHKFLYVVNFATFKLGALGGMVLVIWCTDILFSFDLTAGRMIHPGYTCAAKNKTSENKIYLYGHTRVVIDWR